MIETRINKGAVDILLIAEGTYPFERGGVASWISDIIIKMPNYNFGVIFLGSYEGLYSELSYEVPSNVVFLQLVYLFSDMETKDNHVSEATHKEDFERIIKIHEVLKASHGCPHGLTESIEDIGKIIGPDGGVNYSEFLRSENAWNYIISQYSKYSTDPSFINYFWNIRNMHSPLWILEDAVQKAPHTKVVHTISTGYAGLLATMLCQRYDYPLILSEHGIYTKERNIELLQSPMLIGLDMLTSNRKTFSYQHELWLKFFDSLARICYHYSDLIISLFKSANRLQIAGGADVNKCRVIANGIDIKKFAAARRAPDAPIPKIVCFVGRFVRIKDIKTFIRAVSIMATHDKSIVGWIKTVGLGDSEYIEECMDYINLMELHDNIKFITEGDMTEVLSQVGLLIVSSISEGMPLVVLESIAAGIPVIATDVGACREMIEGCDDIDQSIGSCGEVVGIADASMIATSALKYLNNSELWYKAQQSGIERVEKYYNQTMMIESYNEIYQEAILNGRDRV